MMTLTKTLLSLVAVVAVFTIGCSSAATGIWIANLPSHGHHWTGYFIDYAEDIAALATIGAGLWITFISFALAYVFHENK